MLLSFVYEFNQSIFEKNFDKTTKLQLVIIFSNDIELHVKITYDMIILTIRERIDNVMSRMQFICKTEYVLYISFQSII